VGATTTQLTQALAADKGLTATTMDEAAGTHALATGSILVLAIQRPDGVAYKYDDTNPDARTARMIADRAIQKAAGQRAAVLAVNELVHETGARYIDFVVPGLLGMNLMGSAMWGWALRLLRPAEEAAQAAGGFADAALAISDVVSAVPAGHADHRGRGVSGIRPSCFWSAIPRVAAAAWIAVPAHFAVHFQRWDCWCLRGPGRRKLSQA